MTVISFPSISKSADADADADRAELEQAALPQGLASAWARVPFFSLFFPSFAGLEVG